MTTRIALLIAASTIGLALPAQAEEAMPAATAAPADDARGNWGLRHPDPLYRPRDQAG